MTKLPVREMVLYKHGVGFFVRNGEVKSDRVALTFRSDEINDVLKSLAVFDRAEGGQVLGVHYQTPMDKDHRLASTSVHLSTENSLTDLIRDLRGRHVVMNFGMLPGRIDSITGRIIGINLPHYNDESGTKPTVTLRSTEGEIRVFPLDTLRTFTIEDSQSEQDLTYFLDTAMSEDDRRVVNIRLNDAEHDLMVSYVAPSPTWRVSYRVVAESNDDGSSGTALVQGWGLFDNRLEEDLEDVQVTLVAGQPISFIYDLYASTIPQRKTIRDEARVTGPVEFDSAMPGDVYLLDESAEADPVMDYMEQERARGITAAGVAPVAPAPKGKLSTRGLTTKSVSQSTQTQAEGKATGETFQYVVTTPVSIKRGESALVPIIGAEVEYERELLYNGSKFASHPIAALRFKNTTGFTLERGPVTVVEDSDYKGEAVVPFTKENNEVYLPYAVELGVRVKEETDNRRELYAINIEDSLLMQQEYLVQSTIYTIENTTDQDKTVTVEQALPQNSDLYQTTEPDAETLNEKRWRVPVAGKAKQPFTVTTRKTISRSQHLRDMDFFAVQQWLEQRLLDQDTFRELAELHKTLQFIKKTQTQVEKIKRERQDIYQQQEQLRANLGALGSVGKEANLRNRVLKQLEEKQDRLEEIDREIQVGERTITEAEKQVETMIAELNES